jgi:uncharacterized protein
VTTSSVRTLGPSDYRVMPWKNGLGVTTELVVEPPGAALDAFDWRLSIAELRASGPFSTFAGYDRSIVQLDGPPMTLTHGAHTPVRLEVLRPHAFSGDDITVCEVGGVAHDFNLVVRRAFALGTVTAHALEAGDRLDLDDDAITVLHVLEGSLCSPDEPDLDLARTRIHPPRRKRPMTARVRSVVLSVALRLRPNEDARAAVGEPTP